MEWKKENKLIECKSISFIEFWRNQQRFHLLKHTLHWSCGFTWMCYQSLMEVSGHKDGFIVACCPFSRRIEMSDRASKWANVQCNLQKWAVALLESIKSTVQNASHKMYLATFLRCVVRIFFEQRRKKCRKKRRKAKNSKKVEMQMENDSSSGSNSIWCFSV